MKKKYVEEYNQSLDMQRGIEINNGNAAAEISSATASLLIFKKFC